MNTVNRARMDLAACVRIRRQGSPVLERCQCSGERLTNKSIQLSPRNAALGRARICAICRPTSLPTIGCSSARGSERRRH